MSTTTDDLDALDAEAATLTGWTDIRLVNHRWWGAPPAMNRRLMPRPTRDHGDCLRLMLWTLSYKSDEGTALAGITVEHDAVGYHHNCNESEWYAYDDAPLVAIVRACISALRAVQEQQAAADEGGAS